MACKEYSERLDVFEDYLDGRLPAEAAAAVTAHFERCAACREEVESARLAGMLLRAGLEPTEEPGGVFWTRVRARLREEEEKQRVADFWPALEVLARRFTLTSAAALVLMFAVLLGTEPKETSIATQGQLEVREIFPESVRQPADGNEVLLSLASNGNGR
jgi:anti-sigma factor RsiW